MWRQMWERQSARHEPSRAPGPPQLADPPAIKELVRAEVKMLLQTLRERSSSGRRYVEMHTPSEVCVLSEDCDVH